MDGRITPWPASAVAQRPGDMSIRYDTAERLGRDIPFPVRELAGLRATAVAHHRVWRRQASDRSADASQRRDRCPSSRGTRWLPAQAPCVLHGHPVDRLSTPHANGRATYSGHCPRYALSDSSASTATQTSFYLSYHLLYERCPYQVTQRKRPRVFASELPTAQTAQTAGAAHAVFITSLSMPRARPPAAVPAQARQRSGRRNRTAGKRIDREARERTRDARPGLSGVVRATIVTILIVHIVSG